MTASLRFESTHDLLTPVDSGQDFGGLAPGEIVIDCFAGGGGASEGIKRATGRSPDEGINHSAAALAIHEMNHPETRHHHSDIWEVDPLVVADGRKVGLLWLSPDCTHFSRAKGGKPVSKKIRVLAHVAIRYAKAVRPRVIMLENVPEFLTWGPISRVTGKPDPKRKGHSFHGFVRQLRREGYVVDWRLLRGCDYGAPTTRQRLFLVARCDGAAIRWPKPTHGPGRAHPWRTAAECLDFSLPCPSIFLSKQEADALSKVLGRRVKRPLVKNTMRRIARGVDRFVITAAEPFIVPQQDAAVAPFLVPRYGEDPHRNDGGGQAPRSRSVDRPFPTIVPTGNGAELVAAFMAKHYGGNETPGSSLGAPLDTITETDHHALVAAHLQRDFGQSVGSSLSVPVPTITGGGGGHAAVVASFLSVYYGTEQKTGNLRHPLPTITPTDRFALVAVRGVNYVIVDIGMRTLTARELANGQGFGPDYILDGWYLKRLKTGRLVRKRITETDQKQMIGNSVNPDLADALVGVNLGTPVARERAA
jgi:DNA (cytosine-5)-methyltransferase 1